MTDKTAVVKEGVMVVNGTEILTATITVNEDIVSTFFLSGSGAYGTTDTVNEEFPGVNNQALYQPTIQTNPGHVHSLVLWK